MSSSIVGLKVIIRGNEFVDKDLCAFIVTIDEDKQSILLELEEPIYHSSMTYRHVVAAPRLCKDDLNTLSVKKVLGCSVTWVPESKYNLDEPMDLSWWRGGAATITDLCIN